MNPIENTVGRPSETQGADQLQAGVPHYNVVAGVDAAKNVLRAYLEGNHYSAVDFGYASIGAMEDTIAIVLGADAALLLQEQSLDGVYDELKAKIETIMAPLETIRNAVSVFVSVQRGGGITDVAVHNDDMYINGLNTSRSGSEGQRVMCMLNRQYIDGPLRSGQPIASRGEIFATLADMSLERSAGSNRARLQSALNRGNAD